MSYPVTCDNHGDYVAGCRPCQDAMVRHTRQQADVLPFDPFRTEADDDYVRGLIDEVDEAIAAELRVAYLAQRCTEFLERRAMGIDSSW